MSQILAAQQTALLDLLHQNAIDSVALNAYSIRNEGTFCLHFPDAALRGLRAYRANAQALAHSSLQASHPILRQLLGEDNFRHLAQDFWQAMPPERGDLAQWGGALPAYLPQVAPLQELLAEHPYLPDVARVEWALHTASTATDAALDTPSFELLSTHDPARLRFVLSPGCALIRSAHPVVAVVHWHDARASSELDAARKALAHHEAQNALIWRRGWRPMLDAADVATAALIEATLHRQPLSAALDAAFAQAADFDVSTWLQLAVQTGVLLGVSHWDGCGLSA
jgi:Putative DNA-binding domain